MTEFSAIPTACIYFLPTLISEFWTSRSQALQTECMELRKCPLASFETSVPKFLLTQLCVQGDLNMQQYCSENLKSLIIARCSHLLIYFSFSPPSSTLLSSPPQHFDGQFCGNETNGCYNIPEVFSTKRGIIFQLVAQVENFPRL